MFVLYVPGREIHILASHLQGGMAQDLLQAKNIPSVDQVANTERMPTDVGMEIG